MELEFSTTGLQETWRSAPGQLSPKMFGYMIWVKLVYYFEFQFSHLQDKGGHFRFKNHRVISH